MPFNTSVAHVPPPRRCRRAAALLVVLTFVAALAPAPPTFAAPGIPAIYEQTDPRLVWSEGWQQGSSAAVSGGTHALSGTAGASYSFAFTGTEFSLIGAAGPKYGLASVSVDGGPAQDFDGYSAESAFGRTLYSSGVMPEGLHAVTVTVKGTKSGASADTLVSLDAVRVTGDLVRSPAEQSDTRIVKRGNWSTITANGPSGGSHMLSKSAGDEIAIAFSGTKLDLVGVTGPKSGIVSVSVDGGARVDVDLFSPETAFRAPFFTTGVLTPGAHVVRVYVTGRKNPASADVYVSLDAALAEGTLAQATIRYEESDSRFGYSGEIQAQEVGGPSGGRYAWAGTRWGAASVSFVGSRLDWIATTGPQFGIASVRIDGGEPQYVDLFSPDMRFQQPVYSTGQLAYGQHTVVVSWTGRKNPAASNNYVSYDAFEVGGEPVQAAPPAMPPEAMSFNYPWARYIVVDKSDFRLYFVENGAVVKVYPVAHARVGAVTPNAIWRIDAKYYSDPLGVYGPRKMRLFRQQGSSYVYTAFLIHGTNNPASIGTRASAGCVRMYSSDVIEFYPMVPLGTMVVTRD